jgi:tagaturonate reductase
MNIRDYEKSVSPCRVLQFGEGNFLRAFADYVFSVADRQGAFRTTVTVIKPIRSGSIDAFLSQRCNYTVVERGPEDGPEGGRAYPITAIRRIVDPYENFEEYFALADLPEVRFVVSNTTEAGIVYDPEDRTDQGIADSFPGKVVQLLYRRFTTFQGDPSKGLIFLPCELIDNNGSQLRQVIHRIIERDRMAEAFRRWVDEACIFCNTLVDRIVVGRPADPGPYFTRLGYIDELLTVCEPFLLWVISSGKDVSMELPIDRIGLDVVFTKDITPYRERKVRILNGTHTAITPAALSMGYQVVHEAVADPVVAGFIDRLLREEILDTIPLPRPTMEHYAMSVIERFSNPGLNHRLASISLNTVAKWRARLLPSLIDSLAIKDTLPKGIVFTFAAMTVFYLHGGACRDMFFEAPAGSPDAFQDVPEVAAFFVRAANRHASDEAYSLHDLVTEFCAEESFWGQDLSMLEGFVGMVVGDIQRILALGMKQAMKGVYDDHPTF